MPAPRLDLATRIRALGEFLLAHRPIWSGSPEVAWDRWPASLRRYLATSGDGSQDAAAILDADWETLQVLPDEVHAWRQQADGLTELPELPVDPRAPDRRLSVRIPARKWSQVCAFVRVILPWLEELGDDLGGVIEGCAGKGHLGRTLAAVSGREIRLLESDPALCRNSDLLAQARGAPARADCVDVLSEELDAFLGADSAAVLLHACGDLHLRFLDELRQGRLRAAAVAPCCFFRTNALPLRGWSEPGRASSLELEREELSFATCRATIARMPRRERFVRREAWWLGFEAWCRDTGARLPKALRRRVEPAWLATGFADFSRRLAALEGLSPPSDAALTPYEARGWRALHRAAAFERIRDPFRRALECWIILDRSLALEEAGLQVSVGTFCETTVTPRNVAILARWPDPGSTQVRG